MPLKLPADQSTLLPEDYALAFGRHFAEISRAPLTDQQSSTAQGERIRRIDSGREAAKLLMKGTMLKNQRLAREDELANQFPKVGTRAVGQGRPIINPDGSQSSERTISVEIDGKVQLIPTIVPDEFGYLTKRSDGDAIALFREGKNPSVGTFNTEAEALAGAKQRSAAGGRFGPTARFDTGPSPAMAWDKLRRLQGERSSILSKHQSGTKRTKELDILIPRASMEYRRAVQNNPPEAGAGSIFPDLARHAKSLPGKVLSLLSALEPPGQMSQNDLFRMDDRFLQDTAGAAEVAEVLGKAAVTGPFNVAPDLIGALSSIRFAGMAPGIPGVGSIIPTFDMSGEPIITGDHLRRLVGLDPNNLGHLMGEFLDPTQTAFKLGKAFAATVKAFGQYAPEIISIASPLLHASPFRFEKFDPRHIGTGEGFQAYSRGFYFSSDDLVRGTHGHYLEYFSHHPELKTTIETPSSIAAHELPKPNAFDFEAQYVDELEQVTKNIIDDLAVDGLHPREGVVEELIEQLARFKGDTVRTKAALDSTRKLLDNDLGLDAIELERIDQKLEVLDSLTISRAEPYSYEVHFPDEVVDNLPVWDQTIAQQPPLYREGLEKIARMEFEEWRGVVQQEIDDLEGAIDVWKEYLADNRIPPSFTRGTNQLNEIIGTPKQRPDEAVKGLIIEHEQRIAQKQKDLDRDFNPRKTWGEIVSNLEMNHGPEKVPEMLMEAGIPGIRNRTFATRQALRGNQGRVTQLKTLLNSSEEVHNYAIYDMTLASRIVRRETLDGKILHDTAVTVFDKAATLRKEKEATRAATTVRSQHILQKARDAGRNVPDLNPNGTITLTHYSDKQAITELDPAFHGTGWPGSERRAKEAYPEHWVDRTYFGINVGKPKGYVREKGLGTETYEVEFEFERLYDLQEDHLGIYDDLPKFPEVGIGEGAAMLEKRVLEAGYEGYWVGTDNSIAAAVFTKTKPKPVRIGGRDTPNVERERRHAEILAQIEEHDALIDPHRGSPQGTFHKGVDRTDEIVDRNLPEFGDWIDEQEGLIEGWKQELAAHPNNIDAEFRIERMEADVAAVKRHGSLPFTFYASKEPHEAHFFADQFENGVVKQFDLTANNLATVEDVKALKGPDGRPLNPSRRGTVSHLTPREVVALQEAGFDGATGPIDFVGGEEVVVFSPMQVRDPK